MTTELRELCQYYESLKQYRQTWENDWKELARYFLPRKARFEEDSSRTNKGGLRGGMLDSTPYYAMRDLAAGLHGGMTSPARPWFRLNMQDKTLTRQKAARVWLDQVEEIMRSAFHTSNFYNAIHTLYGAMGSFGTGFMFELADEEIEGGIRFNPLAAGEFCLDANASGRVDTIFHESDMTLRQIAERFGTSRMPDQLQRMYEKKANWAEYFRVVHAVFPRHKMGNRDHNKPFVSIYFLDGYSGGNAKGHFGEKAVLRKSGYNSFPGFGVRWDVTGGDVYGVGPAMDALPDARLLQQLNASILQALQKEINPPMVVPSNMEKVSLLPGAVNYVSTYGGQGQAVYPAIQMRHNIEGTRVAIMQVQQQLKTGLFNDLFRMLMDSNRRQITAREVAAKEEEKLILIGPVLERMHDELFSPLIMRTFDILAEQGRIPPAPENIQGAPIKIEFVSILAQAQKMVSTGAVEQLIGFVGQAAQAFPEMLDAVDADNVFDNYLEYVGAAANIARSKDERDSIRQARAEQQQQMMQQQQQMAGIDAMAKLGGIKADSAAVQALGGVVGGAVGGGAQ